MLGRGVRGLTREETCANGKAKQLGNHVLCRPVRGIFLDPGELKSWYECGKMIERLLRTHEVDHVSTYDDVGNRAA